MPASLSEPPYSGPPYRLRRPIAGRVLAGVAVAAIIAGVWWAAQQQSTVVRKAAEDSVLIPVVPPPPPPPPPEVKPPEPKPEEIPPQPTPQQAQPTPQAPTPAPAAPSQGQAVSIDGPAQAGGDAFNIGSGSGGGRTGAGRVGDGLGGFNRAAYASYLEGEFHRAFESDPKLRNAALRARVRVWIDAKGQITRVDATGSDQADAIRQALVGRMVRPPDPSLAMPVALSLDIRRAG